MLPFAFAENERAYLAELADGRRVPLAFVNGPAGRQIGVDHEQGMTTEEVNIALARFIELALVNLAGLPQNRGGPFGTVQALVFSEDDEACLAAGWQPWHVQQGYALDDNTVTMTTFDMWGNNSTPATDWPEEIMKLVAWDATEKNLGGLGAAPTDAHAATYILRPDGTGAPLVVSDLADAPAFAVTLSGATIPGAAFQGLPPGATEGTFSLALHPTEATAIQADPASGVSVTVDTFANLRYTLERTPDLLAPTFTPVAASQTTGTGSPLTSSPPPPTSRPAPPSTASASPSRSDK